MLSVLDRFYIAMQARMKNFIEDEKGAVDIVAIVVLIGIVVFVAIVFRNQIKGLIDNLFTKINKNAEEVVNEKPT